MLVLDDHGSSYDGIEGEHSPLLMGGEKEDEGEGRGEERSG